jgi:trans-aconitate methyltransferase
MESPAVGQRPVLRRLLGDAIKVHRPQALLLLGCSDGDGLEQVDPLITTQVTCVDINPAYLELLRSRFPHPAYARTLQCADVAELLLEPASFDLVHAALLFEYLPWPIVMPRLASALRPHGALSIVLQLPSLTDPAVTPTPFTSLRQLETIFQFVDPNDVLRRAASLGLALHSRRTVPLPAGKAFEVLHLSRVAV